MSVCWASRIPRGALSRLGASLAALLTLGTAAPLVAATTGRADTGRVIRRITVSDEGVRLQGADHGSGDATISADSLDINGGISIDGKRHRVHIGRLDVNSPSGGNVRIVGPGVLVDSEEGTGLVRLFADADVPVGQRVEGDVVAVFGSVTIEGQVAGNVVAVLGSVRLAPGAVVNGDAVAVGGALDQPTGATVTGQSVSLGFLPIAWGLPALPIVLFAVMFMWLANLLMAWLIHLIFGRRVLRIAQVVSRRTGWSLLLGVFSAPLLIVAMVLLVITVLGIPIAILLPIFFGLVSWVGQIAASYVIGCKLVRRTLGQGSFMLPFAAGTLFVAAFFVAGAAFGAGLGLSRPVALFFYLLGGLLVMGLTTIGTGAALLSGLGARGSEPAPPLSDMPGGVAAPTAAGLPDPAR